MGRSASIFVRIAIDNSGCKEEWILPSFGNWNHWETYKRIWKANQLHQNKIDEFHTEHVSYSESSQRRENYCHLFRKIDSLFRLQSQFYSQYSCFQVYSCEIQIDGKGITKKDTEYSEFCKNRYIGVRRDPWNSQYQ